MKVYHLDNDLKLLGRRVTSFPKVIAEAFNALVDMLPGGFTGRPYYGISYMEGNTIVYHAAALEKFEGEAAQYHCNRYTLEKGDYLSVTVTGWLQKTGSIKDVFHDMMQDSRADHTKPCIEWYKNDNEMDCLLKTKK